MMNSVYVTVDFEGCNTAGDWIACGFLAAEYPSGKKLRSMEAYCRRPDYCYDKSTRRFWDKGKNRDVHRMIQDAGTGRNRLCTVYNRKGLGSKDFAV